MVDIDWNKVADELEKKGMGFVNEEADEALTAIAFVSPEAAVHIATAKVSASLVLISLAVSLRAGLK